MKWARIKDAANEVEVTENDPAGRYVAAIEAEFFPCADGVTTGSTFNGGDATDIASWTVYSPPAAVQATRSDTVNGGRLYNLFSFQEQLDIETSNDAMVQQFLRSLKVAISAGEPIDLGSPNIANGLTYLTAVDVSPVPQSGARKYLANGRKAIILSNTLP